MVSPPVLHIHNWCPDPNTIFEELIEYPWRQEQIKMYGKTFNEPRRVMWFAPKGFSYTYAGKRNEPMEMTDLLQDLGVYVEDTVKNLLHTDVKFNSVFCNMYKDGNDYIGWHKDDERGLASPIIASISLGATRDFQVRRDFDKKTWTYSLANGDLAVMYGDCQENYKHQIPKRKRITSARINLTYRFYLDR